MMLAKFSMHSGNNMKNKFKLLAVLIAVSGTAQAVEIDLGSIVQKSFTKTMVKHGLMKPEEQGTTQGEQIAKADTPTAQQTSGSSASAGSELIGRVFRNPYEDLAKTFKLGKGVSFGDMGKQVVAFDLSSKTGRHVVVLKEKFTDRWVVTGDFMIDSPAKGLAFVGTAEDDGTGDGPPATVCSAAGKTVQAFGFLKSSKKRFDQPEGALAWTVDRDGKPSPVTKLTCKF